MAMIWLSGGWPTVFMMSWIPVLAPPHSPLRNLAVCSAALTGLLNGVACAIAPVPLSK
jgi:hypothetical protein